MPKATINDPTNRGTKRPKAKPLVEAGDKFFPIELPNFDFEITLPDHVSPNEPISLFCLYYTPKIVNKIVRYTNKYIQEPQEQSIHYTRVGTWYPTHTREIYIYLAIRIYMTLYVQNKISSY